MDSLDKKMRRRIRRFIETGNHQARVHQIDENTFEYAVTHGKEIIRFKYDKLKRLRKQKNG